MVSLAIALWAVLGGIWRRVDGGWLGLPKSICIAFGAVLAALPIGWASYHWLGYWPEAAALTLLATGAVMVFFVRSLVPGPSFTNLRVLLKYGPFGLGYIAARWWWPDSWRIGGFIDGSAAVGELFLGASVGACLGCLWGW